MSKRTAKVKKLRTKTFKKMWIPQWPPQPEEDLFEDFATCESYAGLSGSIPVSVVFTELPVKVKAVRAK